MNITPKAIFNKTQKSSATRLESLGVSFLLWLMFGLMLCWLLFVPMQAQAADQLVKMRIGQTADKTRIVFDLSQVPKYQLQSLSNPSRILIQFKNTQNRLSFQKKFLSDSRLFSINVTNKNSITQVELGLHSSYAIKPFTLGKSKEGYERLVVDLLGEDLKPPTSSVAKKDAQIPAHKPDQKPTIREQGAETIAKVSQSSEREPQRAPMVGASVSQNLETTVSPATPISAEVNKVAAQLPVTASVKAPIGRAIMPTKVNELETSVIQSAQNTPEKSVILEKSIVEKDSAKKTPTEKEHLQLMTAPQKPEPKSAVVSQKQPLTKLSTQPKTDLESKIAQMPIENMTKEQIRAALIKLVNESDSFENALETNTDSTLTPTEGVRKANSVVETAPEVELSEKKPIALDKPAEIKPRVQPEGVVSQSSHQIQTPQQTSISNPSESNPTAVVSNTASEMVINKPQEKVVADVDAEVTAEVAKNKAGKTEAIPVAKESPLTTKDSKSVVPSLLDQSKPSDDMLVVAIDAGHGGKDTGAIGPNNSYEKDATLRIAKRIKILIDRVPGMKAVLTRDKDVFIPLYDRVKIAKQNEADIFISLHADAFHDHSVQGGSVYVLSERGASSTMARLLAKKENASFQTIKLATKDDDVVYAISDMSREANIRASRKLAKSVLDAMRKDILVHRHSVQSANFAVLKSIEMPSLLVETAFISNPHEERKLNDPKFQNRVATSVVRGIKSFVNSFADQPRWGEKLFVHYRVKKGDTLTKIAENYQVSVAELKRINKIRNPNRLYVGKLVKIPLNEDLLVAS